MRVVLAVVVFCGTLALAPPAVADDGDTRQAPPKVTRDGRRVVAELVDLRSTTGLKIERGAGNAGPGHWDPPPCWYAPSSSAEFGEYLGRLRRVLHGTGDDLQPGGLDEHKRLSGELAKHADDPNGTWYELTCSNWGAPEAQEWLHKPPFVWVGPNGGLPAPPGPTLSPKDLAEYARSSMILPELKPVLSPNPPARSTVNSPTWVHVPKAEKQDIIATLGNMTVTVVATPTKLHLDTTAPADYAPDQDCEPRNGGFGSAYASGREPDCAVIFRKASAGGTGAFPLTTTVTWTITWTFNGAQNALDPADIGTTTEVPVQEIQTVVTSRS
jgi:hypothetical protein